MRTRNPHAPLLAAAAVVIAVAAGISLGSVGHGGASTTASRSTPIPGASSTDTGNPPWCADSTTCPAQAASASAARSSMFPPLEPIDPAKAWTSKADVMAAARRMAQDPDNPGAPLSETAAQQLPAVASLTTYGSFIANSKVSADNMIDAARPVWVVVVHGFTQFDSLPATVDPRTTASNVYTVIYDASTGGEIQTGFGYDATSILGSLAPIPGSPALTSR